MALASVVVMGATGVLLATRTDVGAIADGGVEVVSRDGVNGGPWAEPAGAPSMSADGTIEVFQGQRDGVPSVGVRDRVAGTTTAAPGAVARNGAVSANGCVVAYVTADSDAGPWTATIVDGCADVAFEVPGERATALPAPGISADGGLVVWSTGTTLLVLHRVGDTYEPAAGPAGLPQAAVLGPDVDVSDDGSVVVVAVDAAGPSQVYAWLRDPLVPGASGTIELVSAAAGDDPADGDSTRPTVSADGTLVAFETLSAELAGDTATPAVVVRDRNQDSVRVAAPDATDPDLSSGGRDVVFVRDGAVRLATWSAGAAPFETVVETVIAVATDPDAPTPSEPAPVVSADGSRVAFTSDQGPSFTSDVRFATGTHVWLRDRSVLQVADLDVGDVTVGSFVDRATTVTNGGPVGVALGVPSAAAPFSVVATTCAGVLAPGASCDVTVRFTPVTTSSATGALTVVDAFDATRVASGALHGRGVAPAASSSTTTTTVPPSSTTTTSTTVAPTTSVPRVVRRPRIPTTIPRRTTTTTPRGNRPLGTSQLAFSPQLVVLDPVVAGTGRATSVVSLTNVGLASATVTNVALDPSSGPGFVIDAATCVGLLLAPGTACQIAIEFTTNDVGEVTGLLVADASDGATATVELSAAGVEPPFLTATPDVAGDGQVVTVTGSEFPAGEELTLWWGSEAVAVTTDSSGSFRVPLVVMRHTAAGPLVVRVDGAPERFPTTEADVLVRASGTHPASPAVRPTAGDLFGG
jgi:Abnormal spindle-like microcephaly-assoc'd, ASPM-SPD-2-Hydin/WD40-like Beta Propeller Repeat